MWITRLIFPLHKVVFGEDFTDPQGAPRFHGIARTLDDWRGLRLAGSSTHAGSQDLGLAIPLACGISSYSDPSSAEAAFLAQAGQPQEN
jgi:hypothetical protein